MKTRKTQLKFIIILFLHNGISIFIFLLFRILSTSNNFSFTRLEQRIFFFLSDLFIILMTPDCIILAFLIVKIDPKYHEEVKQFYNDIRSVKTIQKIGLVVALSGAAIFIISLLLAIYNLVFLDSVYLEGLFGSLYFLGLALILGGTLFFVLFFGKKKLKAKTWRELIDGINENNLISTFPDSKKTLRKRGITDNISIKKLELMQRQFKEWLKELKSHSIKKERDLCDLIEKKLIEIANENGYEYIMRNDALGPGDTFLLFQNRKNLKFISAFANEEGFDDAELDRID